MFIDNDTLKDEFNITMEDITNIYLNGVSDSEHSKEVIKKLCRK